MCPTVTQRRPKRRGTSSESHQVSAPLANEAFLNAAAEPVREELTTSMELPDFLETVDPLSLAERQTLVDQALVLLSDNYVHLPFKVSMHGINPLRRLRLLRTRLERQTDETMDSDHEFHAEMSGIFHSMRDLHTNYLLPFPYRKMFAYLPFLVEEYREDCVSHYIVSHIVQGYSAPGFGRGAEITYWNGIPIDRAVDLNAARFAGSNAAARHVRGVESLTLRSLRIHLPPDEEWVTVNYVDVDGAEHELSEKWLVVENRPVFNGESEALRARAATMGLDIGADDISRARRTLFAPESIELERIVAATGAPPVTSDGAEVPSTMPRFFRTRRVETPSGRFGHVRIFSFNVPDPDAFVEEFIRLAGLLPQEGLIVDVRGNSGGDIWASEFTLQTISPRKIEPEPMQFINTALNLRICRTDLDLGPWVESMDQALETGEVFSSAFPLTPRDAANAVGQKYHGPVLLITDAGSYSATDIFAAGFQDHEIGPVLGVDENTGAGGANVWEHTLLKDALDSDTADADSPYKELPQGAVLRVAIRRTLRIGRRFGTPLEDLGVIPDVRYDLTREDLLNDNVGLLNRAGEILATMPMRKLEATAVTAPEGQLNVQIEANNLDRADIYVDGRPRDTIDLTGPSTSVSVEGQSGAKVRIEGYDEGKLAAAYTFVA